MWVTNAEYLVYMCFINLSMEVAKTSHYIVLFKRKAVYNSSRQGNLTGQ